VILENCDLGNDWAKSLADKLDSYKSLVRLDIKNNNISAKGLTYLCSAMSSPECKIKFIDIRHNLLMDNQLKVLLNLLNKNDAIEEI